MTTLQLFAIISAVISCTILSYLLYKMMNIMDDITNEYLDMLRESHNRSIRRHNKNMRSMIGHKHIDVEEYKK